MWAARAAEAFSPLFGRSGCQNPLSQPTSLHPPSAVLTSDVWSHSALTRLVPSSAMERKNEGKGNSKYSGLVFTCCLLQTFFEFSVVLTLRAWIPHPVIRETEGEFFCVYRRSQTRFTTTNGWMGGWLGEWGCYFSRAKHAAAPLRILDYGGIPPTAVVKAWLRGKLILPEMSATSNIGNKTTWRDKQSWSGPTVTAEGTLLFE